MLRELNSQENPIDSLSSIKDIYATLIGVVERVMRTDSISLWEKKVTRDGFILEFIDASESLGEQYKAHKFLELPSNSFTGDAVVSGDVRYVSLQEIDSDKFAFREIALSNGLKSMTCIPIRIGQETYGVIDAFRRRDSPPTPEEITALELQAGNAALAIQSAKLIDWFNTLTHTARAEF